MTEMYGGNTPIVPEETIEEWSKLYGLKTEPTDIEILEFLLDRFQMHSPKMNGQHSWRFMNDYLMGKAIGRSAKEAVIACMKKQTKENVELEQLND